MSQRQEVVHETVCRETRPERLKLSQVSRCRPMKGMCRRLPPTLAGAPVRRSDGRGFLCRGGHVESVGASADGRPWSAAGEDFGPRPSVDLPWWITLMTSASDCPAPRRGTGPEARI